MAKKKSEAVKKPAFRATGVSEKWESGHKVSEASILERIDDNKKGISIRIGTKSKYRTNPRYGKTIWIDEDLDLPSWLGWFIKTVKKLYFDLFGKHVSIDEQEQQYQAKIEQLTKKLADTQNVLDAIRQTQEADRHLIEFAAKVKGSYDNFQKLFTKLKDLVKQSASTNKGMEEEIKSHIKENPWLLGLECFVEAKNQAVDTQTQIDLHVKTKYDQDRIFELKSPNVKPFIRKEDKTKRRLEISPDLADALSELVLYLERTNLYAHQANEGNYGILKPSGCIVIGYNLDDEEKRLLRYLNYHLAPHIQILTYDELLASTERELSMVQNPEGRLS